MIHKILVRLISVFVFDLGNRCQRVHRAVAIIHNFDRNAIL